MVDVHAVKIQFGEMNRDRCPKMLLHELSMQGEDEPDPDDLKALESQVASLREQQRRLIRLFGQGGIDEELLKEEIATVERQAGVLEGRIKSLKPSPMPLFQSVDERALAATALAISSWIDRASAEDRGEILEALQVSITASQTEGVLRGVLPLDLRTDPIQASHHLLSDVHGHAVWNMQDLETSWLCHSRPPFPSEGAYFGYTGEQVDRSNAIGAEGLRVLGASYLPKPPNNSSSPGSRGKHFKPRFPSSRGPDPIHSLALTESQIGNTDCGFSILVPVGAAQMSGLQEAAALAFDAGFKLRPAAGKPTPKRRQMREGEVRYWQSGGQASEQPIEDDVAHYSPSPEALPGTQEAAAFTFDAVVRLTCDGNAHRSVCATNASAA